MELVVAPVFHRNDAVATPVAVNTEVPQSSTTDTEGAEGFELTVNVAALEVTLPATFVHTARY
jgi:hypothetical protein